MLVFLHRSTDSSATWTVCDPSSQRWHCYHSRLMFYSRLMFMWFFVTAVTETYQWSGWNSSSFVIDIFFVCKMFHNFNIAFDYLLMLTIFHVQNVLIILDWCLCDLLLLKHINEVDGLPSSFVTYWYWHIFCVGNILWFQYWFWLFTDVDYFSYAKCSYHSRLMFMWFSVKETYRWSACTSCWFVIYSCWHIFFVWKIFYNLSTAFDYLLMLTIFHVPKFL